MRTVFVLTIWVYLLVAGVAQAEVYRWVDADGRIVYGDSPPKKSGAKAVNLPNLTVADGYVPKPAEMPPVTPNAPSPVAASPSANPEPPVDETPPPYSAFKITAPAAEETVRSTEGVVKVSLALTPALKTGDSVTVYLDSKQAATAAGDTLALKDVASGTHRIFAVLSDAAGNIIQNTETVTFHLQRHTIAAKP